MVWSKRKKGTAVSRYRYADEAFSKLVRFKNANHQGYIRCITCRKIEPPEDVDAGHYISRSIIPLRYSEINVHPQCRKCNRFNEGMKDEYALALIKEYGADILEELNKEKYTIRRYSDLELKEMAKEWRKELKELNI